MKSIYVFIFSLQVMAVFACSKNSGTNPTNNNHKPLVSMVTNVTSADPFTVDFTVTATDADGDALTYAWDFGDGTTKQGSNKETHNYTANNTYTATVSVTDGKSSAVVVSATINTTVTNIVTDATTHYQVMDGFGGFGAKDVYWSSGPFTSTSFVNDVINDLGLTILRDNVPTNFEDVNDDNDPYTTNLSNFNYGSFTDHIQYLKDMKATGLQKLIISCWSPAAWMKTNNNVNGDKADAPAYNNNPTGADNQLRTDMYEEFAERCVAYIKIVQQETGLDVYGMSLQNEPRFTEPYESCVFNGTALRDLIKVVGKRFADDGITTKIFMPEDIGYLDGVSGMVQPTLDDAEARKYVSIVAVHGYALDGVTANSPDALTWQTMYGWGATYHMPLWMTETSGYSNDMDGAMALGKAMYTAINFGNVSGWLYWELSQQNLDEFSLMSSSGTKSKRYYVSKNFYRYVRPGDTRIKCAATDNSNVYALAFKNDTANTTAIVVINDNTTARAIKLDGASLPPDFSMYITSATEDCKDNGTISKGATVLVPAQSVITFYKKN